MPLLQWLTHDADVHAVPHAPFCLLEEGLKLSRGNRDSATAFLPSEITASPLFPFFLPYRL